MLNVPIDGPKIQKGLQKPLASCSRGNPQTAPEVVILPHHARTTTSAFETTMHLGKREHRQSVLYDKSRQLSEKRSEAEAAATRNICGIPARAQLFFEQLDFSARAPCPPRSCSSWIARQEFSHHASPEPAGVGLPHRVDG